MQSSLPANTGTKLLPIVGLKEHSSINYYFGHNLLSKSFVHTPLKGTGVAQEHRKLCSCMPHSFQGDLCMRHSQWKELFVSNSPLGSTCQDHLSNYSHVLTLPPCVSAHMLSTHTQIYTPLSDVAHTFLLTLCSLKCPWT